MLVALNVVIGPSTFHITWLVVAQLELDLRMFSQSHIVQSNFNNSFPFS